MGYIFGAVKSSGSGGGAVAGVIFGASIAANVPAGTTDAFDPGGGFPGTATAPTGRLELNPNAGDAILQGLKAAAVDGQALMLRNASAVNNLTLANNASGTAGDSFLYGPGDLMLTPGVAVLLVWDTGVNAWIVLA